MMFPNRAFLSTPFAVPALELSPSPGLESCCGSTFLGCLRPPFPFFAPFLGAPSLRMLGDVISQHYGLATSLETPAFVKLLAICVSSSAGLLSVSGGGG